MSKHIEKKEFYDVYKFGKYFNPSHKHYDRPGPIGCDRCETQDIAVCIGYGDLDLCMDCVCEINELYELGELVVNDIRDIND
jgi:hypothetical protein